MNMRSFYSLLGVLILLLSSCTPVRDRRTLNDMEALMPERPDSALAVLRVLQPRDLPGLHVRPLHALLLSEALDKNYIDLTDDSLALTANRYYGGHGSQLHRLKSWYYLGRIRFNAGNYAEAVICYNKALEYAEALTNYHYIGLINRETANAYDSVWDTIHAIERLQESVKAFKSANEERYVAYSELALITCLLKLKRYDEAKTILKELDRDLNDSYLSASVALKKAQLAINEGTDNYDEVLSFYNSAGIGKILPITVNRLSKQAVVHQLAGQVDSANIYIEIARKAVKTRGDSVVFEYDKSQIEALRGNYNTAYDLLNRSYHSQDSSVYAALNQSVSYYQGYYYQNESRMNAMKARTRALSYGIVLLLLFILSIFLLSSNRKQRAMIVEEIARTSEVEQELSEMKDEKIGMNRAMATLFENRVKILQKLSEQYDILEDKQQRKMREKGMELSRDEIIDMFRKSMKELRKDKDIALSMEETLNSWKDGIMRKLRDIFGEDGTGNVRMTNEELNLAPFFFSGMKSKTISYLTGFTEPSLRVRKTRIKQKIQALDGSFSKEKHLFLDNI